VLFLQKVFSLLWSGTCQQYGAAYIPMLMRWWQQKAGATCTHGGVYFLLASAVLELLHKLQQQTARWSLNTRKRGTLLYKGNPCFWWSTFLQPCNKLHGVEYESYSVYQGDHYFYRTWTLTTIKAYIYTPKSSSHSYTVSIICSWL